MTKQKLLKLNLGCGRDLKEGWVNLDIVPEFHPDVVHDLANPLPFPESSTDEVLAQDILEHFTYEDVDLLISEIARVLVVGGKVHIRVPNVDQIISQFKDNHWVRNHFLYGNTEETGIFGAHKIGFTPETLLTKMMQWGLFPEKLTTIETNFEGTFIRKKLKNASVKSIVYVNQSLSLGGAETFMTDLLESFQQDHNSNIKIYTNHTGFDEQLRKKSLQTEHTTVIIDLIGDWKGIVKALVLWPLALWQYLQIAWKSRSADIIIVSGFTEKIFLTPIAAFLKIPVIWIEFSPLTTVFEKHFQLPKFLYRLVKSLPDTVIVPSKHTKQYLIPESRIDLDKCIVIPCGRNFSMLNQSQNIKTTKKTIVCVSRMEPGKGQELLIQAIPKIIKKHPNYLFQFVGSGDYLDTLVKLAKNLKVHSHIEFTGYVPDAIQYIQHSTICVFPSMWSLEGFGLVMIEAMANGKPVVAFARGPALEIIEDGKTGLLAKPGDVNDLALQIITLLDNSTLATTIGRNAQGIAQQKYDIKHVANTYLSEFSKVQIKRDAKDWLTKHSLSDLN